MGVSITKVVKDRLYLEADNGCGFCGLRDARALTIHHIEHDGKVDNSYDNLLVLCHNCHTTYHRHKGISKAEIVSVKRRCILKTLTPFGLNALKIAYRKRYIAGTPFTLVHLVELGFLKKEGVNHTMEIRHDDGTSVSIEMGVLYEITSKGKDFFKKWRL